MLFGAGSEFLLDLKAKRKTVARNSPSTHSDKVSCVYGSRGTYASKSSMTVISNWRQTIGMNRKNTNKHRRYDEGLNGGAFRSTFRLRFVAILAHMMLEDDTYARPRKRSS
jgi:hypothetical protein